MAGDRPGVFARAGRGAIAGAAGSSFRRRDRCGRRAEPLRRRLGVHRRRRRRGVRLRRQRPAVAVHRRRREPLEVLPQPERARRRAQVRAGACRPRTDQHARRLPDRSRRRRRARPRRAARRRDAADARSRRLPLRACQRTLELRRRQRVDHRLRGRLAGRRGASDACLRHLRRPRTPGLPLGQLHRQPARAPGRAARRSPSSCRCALRPGYCALGMLFSDWNRSGLPALRITNDREYYKGGQEQLWHIEPGAAPRLFGAGEGWQPLQIWGMGIASADLDGSGYPAYFLTSMADNKLQVLASGGGRPEYRDIAFAKGVTAHRPFAGGDVHPSTAWHAQFADVNNDGLARPVRGQGQRRQHAGLCDARSERPAAAAVGRTLRRGGKRGRIAELPARARRVAGRPERRWAARCRSS